MARASETQAAQAGSNAQALAGQGGLTAQNTYAQLFPTYSRMAQGQATPGSVAANTAAQQSIGGAESGLVGRGVEQAARTGNAAGSSAAAGNVMREGGKQLSNIANENKANEVSEGLHGLQELYQSGLGSEEAGTGASVNAADAMANAENAGWFNRMIGPLVNGMGSAAIKASSGSGNGDSGGGG